MNSCITFWLNNATSVQKNVLPLGLRSLLVNGLSSNLRNQRMLFQWKHSKGVKPTHGCRLVLDLLLRLCNVKNWCLPPPALDMLWSLLPQVLSFLFIARKFITWIVFHSHDELVFQPYLTLLLYLLP